MKFKLICLLLILILGGCSTYAVDRYSISADNVTALRALDIEKISVGEFTSFEPGLTKIMCRGEGPIKTPDGNTFVEYIRESLIDELQIAEIYSPDAPVILTGHLENINFSSTAGKWNLSLTIKSSNGKSILVDEEYKYTTSFMASTACNQTAQALMPGVQNLIKKIVTNPHFPNLVGAQIHMEKKHANATDEKSEKIAVSFNTKEPWTGTWEVESSGAYGGGQWVLKQQGNKVKSAGDSRFDDLVAEVKGNELKGMISQRTINCPIKLKISADGQSFEGTFVGFANRTEWLKGKRKK